MEKIVLTGGIASGKSTVSRYLVDKGYPIIDADLIARRVVEPGQPGLTGLISAFGSTILTDRGTLDRSLLGSMLFQDETVKDRVNALLHPLIQAAMVAEVREHRDAGFPLVFLDIPLYYETQEKYDAKEVWLVYLPASLQLQRLIKRNHYSQAQAQQRLDSQLSIESKKVMADVVLDNSGSMASLYRQVDRELARLRQHWENREFDCERS